MSHFAHTRWRIAVAGGGVALSLLLAACSSSGGSNSDSSSSSTTSTDSGSGSTDALGTPKAASGPTLKIGWATDGVTSSYDNTTEVKTAQAAAHYVNDYLGGVGKAGYKLELDVCSTKGTPAGATNCANQFIADRVPVVLGNVSGQFQVMWTVLSKAHLPLMMNGSIDPGPLTGQDAYILENNLASSYAGAAAVAQKANAKSAAALIIDVPAAAGTAHSLMPGYFKNAGIANLNIVTIPPGTADMTAQVQSAISKGADFFYVNGDSNFCTTALKATTSLGFKGTTDLLQNCIAPGAGDNLPNGYSGMETVLTKLLTDSNPDVVLYRAAVKKYDSGTDPFTNGNTPGGFATVIDFARAAADLTGTTASDVEAAFKGMAEAKLFMGGGLTFACDGKQMSVAPGVCSPSGLLVTLDKSGQPTGTPTVLSVASVVGS